VPYSPATTLAVDEEWGINIITDDETVWVSPLPMKMINSYARSFAMYGALLEQNGHTSIFIPAARIKKMWFEKVSDHKEPEVLPPAEKA